MYAVSQISKVSNASSRTNLTDTDSLALSTLRSISNWERWMHCIYRDNPTLYRDTEIAKELASNLYREWHTILDYSSCPQDSVLFQAFFAKSNPLSTMFRYLSCIRHKRLLTFQSEVGFSFLAALYSPAPKSYSIHSLDLDKATIPNTEPSLSYPADPHDPINLIPSKNYLKKAKGTRRAILKTHGTIGSYLQACKTSVQGESVSDLYIKKHRMKLYIMRRKKVVLTRTIIKRLSYDELRTSWSHFTFPLHFKNLCKKYTVT